jgi:hypothetical protein
MFEWLTLWPTCGPLAVSSQRRDMAKSSMLIRRQPVSALAGIKFGPFQERRTYKGRGLVRQDAAGRSRSYKRRNLLAKIAQTRIASLRSRQEHGRRAVS